MVAVTTSSVSSCHAELFYSHLMSEVYLWYTFYCHK